VAVAQSSVSLLPIDADFRLVALRGLQEAQTEACGRSKAAC
jgi:hypothetical protein